MVLSNETLPLKPSPSCIPSQPEEALRPVSWSELKPYIDVFERTGESRGGFLDVYGQPTIKDASDVVLAASAFGNRFLFTGREFIAEIGLYDYRNRFYSPEFGRFLETDSLGFDAGDYNLYRYVGNNPINYIDPLGLAEELCCKSGTWSGNIKWIGVGGIIGFGYFWGTLECTSDPLTANVNGVMWPFGLAIKILPGTQNITVSGANTKADLVGKSGTFFYLGVRPGWRGFRLPIPIPQAAWVGWTIRNAK